MARQISEKRYQKLLGYERREKQWNELMADPNIRKMFDPEQQRQEEQKRKQEEQEFEKQLEEEKARFEADLIAMDIEAEMFAAATRMKMDEILAVETLEYRRGFLDGIAFKEDFMDGIAEIFHRNTDEDTAGRNEL